MCFDCGSHLKTSQQQKHVWSTKAPWREYKRNCDLNNFDDVGSALSPQSQLSANIIQAFMYEGLMFVQSILLIILMTKYSDQ